MSWLFPSYIGKEKNLNRYVSGEKFRYSPDRNTFRIRLSWNFNFGRRYEGGEQRLENGSGENAVF